MEKATAARRPARDDGGWLVSYRPMRMDPQTWLAVRPFVIAYADRLGLDDSPGAIRTVRVLARLAAWASGEGLPLDAELVLDPDTVERFVAVGIADDRSRATSRAVLRRVAPLLTKRAPWEARPPIVARRKVALPYSAAELGGLRVDALDQPSAGRIRAARVLLAFGAGAGLDGRWVARVAADDVTSREGAVLVRVGQPAPRVVPVLASWEHEVLELAGLAGDEFLVGGRSLARNRLAR